MPRYKGAGERGSSGSMIASWVVALGIAGLTSVALSRTDRAPVPQASTISAPEPFDRARMGQEPRDEDEWRRLPETFEPVLEADQDAALQSSSLVFAAQCG